MVLLLRIVLLLAASWFVVTRTANLLPPAFAEDAADPAAAGADPAAADPAAAGGGDDGDPAAAAVEDREDQSSTEPGAMTDDGGSGSTSSSEVPPDDDGYDGYDDAADAGLDEDGGEDGSAPQGDAGVYEDGDDADAADGVDEDGGEDGSAPQGDADGADGDAGGDGEAGGEDAGGATTVSPSATEEDADTADDKDKDMDAPAGVKTPPPMLCDDENIDFDYYASRTVREALIERENLSRMRESLAAVEYLDDLLDDAEDGNKVTVLAPMDHVIEGQAYWMRYLENSKNWKAQLRHTVNNHIIRDVGLTKEDLEDGQHKTMEDSIFGDSLNDVIDMGVRIVCTIPASNGYLHILNRIVRPKFWDHDLSSLEMMPEFGPDRDVQQRVSLVDVVDQLDARYMYERRFENGMTHIGCRIRAFNRINDYHKYTINDAEVKSVKWGELMNETFKNESFHNFIEYNLIEDKIFDVDSYDHGHEELIMASNWCAHMWVTKHQDKICFNNACLVISPPAFSKVGTPMERRIQNARNGIAYVVDKCLVCPGISMLAEYAAEYTIHNMKDVSQFFTSSEWNRRNLSMNEGVGDGGPVTLFAAVNTGWDALTGEDITRLSTDMWKPHQHDFLRHMMIQGNFTEEELRQMVEAEESGILNVTSLANQTLYLEIDEDRDKLMVNGGDVFMNDIHGVDGMMHFVSQVPLVRSVTHSVYDIGHWLDNHYEQLNLIDGVFLDSDLRRLEPITGLFAPDEEWRNKIITPDMIEPVLESHIFETLLWCDVLRDYAKEGKTVESQNKAIWSISVNDFDMPCFDTITDFGEEQARSCVIECDHLARNGIVHVVDKVLLNQDIATRGPMMPLPEGARPPIKDRPDGILDKHDTNPWYHKGDDDKPVDYSRPKRQYGFDEVDDDPNFKDDTGNKGEKSGAVSTQRREAILVTATIPLLLLLLLA